MKTKYFLLAIFLPMFSIAQEKKESTPETKDNESGKIQLGLRSVLI